MDITNEFAIEYIQEGCEGCPEYDFEAKECLSNSHCFEVKKKAIKALQDCSKCEKMMPLIKQTYEELKAEAKTNCTWEKVIEDIKNEILSLKGDNFPNSYYVKIIDKHIKAVRIDE